MEAHHVNIESRHSAGADAMASSTRKESYLRFRSDVPLLHDAPSKIILDEAGKWHADMMVVGSHGRSGFDRFTMGSVSEAVALHADCSVEVIRRGSQAAG